MQKSLLTCSLLLVGILCFSGCMPVNLPFNSRLAYPQVREAKNLTTIKNEPVSLKWSPPEFPTRIDIQGASGFTGGGTNTRIPIGIGLSHRIMEALDLAIGIDDKSKRLLEINVLSAESKFEYSAGSPWTNTLSLDYGWCSIEIEIIYNGNKWIEKFVSEEKDTTAMATSQTAVLEKVWDNLAIMVARSLVDNINKSNSTSNVYHNN